MDPTPVKRTSIATPVIIACTLFLIAGIMVAFFFPRTNRQPVSEGIADTHPATVTPPAGLLPTTEEFLTVSGPQTLGINTEGAWNIIIPAAMLEQSKGLEYAADFSGTVFQPDQNGIAGFQSDTSFRHAFEKPGRYTINFYAREKSTGKPFTKILDSTRTVNVGVAAKPSVFSITPITGKPGAAVSISGSGFSASGNTVTFTYTGGPCGMFADIRGVASIDGRTLAIYVPAAFSQPDCAGNGNGKTNIAPNPGIYDVSVSNLNGSSYTKANLVEFTIQ